MDYDPVRLTGPARDVAQPAQTRVGPGSPRSRGQAAPLNRSARTDEELLDTRSVTRGSRAEQVAVDPKDLERATEDLNRTLDALAVTARFRIDYEDQSLQVIVENRETGEVIRKIPPDETLRMRDHLEQLAGLLFDANA